MRNIPNIKSILAVVGGVGAGLGLMYLFDPKNGADRRAAIRERADGILERAAEISADAKQALYSSGSELKARAQEVIHDAAAVIPLINQQQSVPDGHRIKASTPAKAGNHGIF